MDSNLGENSTASTSPDGSQHASPNGLDPNTEIAAMDSELDEDGKEMFAAIKDSKLSSLEDGEKRRQLRLMKNRQSAALSRQRKKEYISNLQKQVSKFSTDTNSFQHATSKLTTQNWENKIHIERLEKEILKLINENNELKSKLKEMGVYMEDKPRQLPEFITTLSPDSIHHNE